MNKEELLEKIRKERPNQVIHNVISFKKNKDGYYDVLVDMEAKFFESKIKHTMETIPYPLSQHLKLKTEDKIAEYIEKYRNDKSMTSHRIAKNIIKMIPHPDNRILLTKFAEHIQKWKNRDLAYNAVIREVDDFINTIKKEQN